MAAVCLPAQALDAFKRALVEGKINPSKLHNMTSEERSAAFKDIVGEDGAELVNTQFEKKLLLKNVERGILNWAKDFSGISAESKALISQKLKSEAERKNSLLWNPKDRQEFLGELVKDSVHSRYKVNVSFNEARRIVELSKKITDTGAKANEEHIFPTLEDRLAHGVAKVNLEDYVNKLKLQSNKLKFIKNPVLKVKDAVGATPGVLKSIVSSLDDSFFGRQGIKTLLDVRTSHIWAKNFAKSFVDIGRELKGKDAMNVIKSDIYSRPNALSGKYRAGRYGLDVLSEEAYPSALLERIPLLGRLFKASESAYNGGALRLRADLADRYIKIAEKQGINTLDKTEAEGLGTLVGGLTGRGNLDKGEALAKEANALLFSVKFLKANFDTLTAHTLNSKATAFTRKEAAKNLAAVVASVAGILTIAHALDPNSIDQDPRSPNFGKVKLFGKWTDITGGLSSLSTLAARTLVPTQHDGKWGLWSKSKSGVYTNLLGGEFGQQTALDTFNNFWEGKLSPAAGIVRDVWSGKNYQGQKPTITNEGKGVVTPISIQTYNQLKDSSNWDKLGSMLADGLGLSVNTNSVIQPGSWQNSTAKDLTTFKSKVGDKKFTEASKKYDDRLKSSLDALYANNDFQKQSDDEKQAVITNRKTEAKKETLKEYGFKYKAPKKKKNPLIRSSR